MKGPVSPVMDERQQDKDGRVTHPEFPLAKTITTAFEKWLKKSLGLPDSATHEEIMIAFVNDAYKREFGKEPTMKKAEFDALAMLNTSAGMAARWLGWLGYDTDNDPVLIRIRWLPGARIELYPGGPYITFRDYQYNTAFD